MGVVLKELTEFEPSSFLSLTSLLEKANISLGYVTVILKVALRAGSSKHGNMERASRGSKKVEAKYLWRQIDQKSISKCCRKLTSEVRETMNGGIAQNINRRILQQVVSKKTYAMVPSALRK